MALRFLRRDESSSTTFQWAEQKSTATDNPVKSELSASLVGILCLLKAQGKCKYDFHW